MFDSSELRIPRKQASWIAALLIFCFFIMFCVGYYLGKRQITLIGSNSHSQISFDDQDKDAFGQSLNYPMTAGSESATVDQPGVVVAHDDTFVAQLIGYGTHKKAKDFVKRLNRKGIKTELKTRVSTTNSGKKITWYQVVTKPYTDKKALQSLVDRIVKLEHIRNYRIIKLSL